MRGPPVSEQDKRIGHTKNKSTGFISKPVDFWSERRDLNPRPPPPQGGALPSCATPRYFAGLLSAEIIIAQPVLKIK